MKNQARYYDEINIARAIGILLVVLGHAMKQIEVQSTAVSVLIQFIYSFHMPLFFFLSGFVSSKILDYKDTGAYVDYGKKRIRRLLLPYIVMAILYMPLKYFMSRFARNPYDFASSWKILLGYHPNTTMWFLYTLFWVALIIAILVNRRSLQLWTILTAILSLLTYSCGLEWRIPRYLFFFLLGIYIHEAYDRFSELYHRGPVWILLLLILFLGNVAIWYGISGAQFFTSIAGTLLCLLLSYHIAQDHGSLYDSAMQLGYKSMDIYILSDIVQTVLRLAAWNILHLPYLLVISLCFIGGVIGPMVLSVFFVRRIRILRILLLGED